MWWHTPLIPTLGGERCRQTSVSSRCGGTHLKSKHLGDRARQISVSSRTAWSTKGVTGQKRHTENLSQKVKNLKIKINKMEFKIKLHKDGKHTENLDAVYFYALFELFEC